MESIPFPMHQLEYHFFEWVRKNENQSAKYKVEKSKIKGILNLKYAV